MWKFLAISTVHSKCSINIEGQCTNNGWMKKTTPKKLRETSCLYLLPFDYLKGSILHTTFLRTKDSFAQFFLGSERLKRMKKKWKWMCLSRTWHYENPKQSFKLNWSVRIMHLTDSESTAKAKMNMKVSCVKEIQSYSIRYIFSIHSRF